MPFVLFLLFIHIEIRIGHLSPQIENKWPIKTRLCSYMISGAFPLIDVLFNQEYKSYNTKRKSHCKCHDKTSVILLLKSSYYKSKIKKCNECDGQEKRTYMKGCQYESYNEQKADEKLHIRKPWIQIHTSSSFLHHLCITSLTHVYVHMSRQVKEAVQKVR